MAEMKFKFTIQPYQTEAVESVVNIFAGQPFNDRFTYRRDVDISRIQEPADSDPLLGFANAKVQLTAQQLLENIRKMQARNNIKLSDKLAGSWEPAPWTWRWKPAQARLTFTSRPCSS